LTPTQVQSVLGFIRRYFSKHTLSVDELQLFGEAIERLDIDEHQAEAVVKQHRLAVRYSNPSFPELIQALRAAVQVKPVERGVRDAKRNLLVDVYRRRFDLSPHMGDIEVAKYVARQVAPSWGEDGARNHLRDMLAEFLPDEIESWRIVFEQYPHEAMQARVRERIKRTREKLKKREAKRDGMTIEEPMMKGAT
jgi:hypothetical protein